MLVGVEMEAVGVPRGAPEIPEPFRRLMEHIVSRPPIDRALVDLRFERWAQECVFNSRWEEHRAENAKVLARGRERFGGPEPSPLPQPARRAPIKPARMDVNSGINCRWCAASLEGIHDVFIMGPNTVQVQTCVDLEEGGCPNPDCPSHGRTRSAAALRLVRDDDE
jgi:hypothetical protein